MNSLIKRTLSDEEQASWAELNGKSQVKEYKELLRVILQQRFDELMTKEVDFDKLNWGERRAMKDGRQMELEVVFNLL